jgi:hypothetical protein
MTLFAGAQTPPAASTNPADTVAYRIGATIFSDYTYQDDPSAIDADGNRFHPSAFNIGRAYINVTGNLNRRIHFRVTPDIVRESGPGSSVSGSYTFRLKYAYAQLNLDEWSTKGSYLRAGMHQTPYLEFIETIYKYRFQGGMLADREGYLTSADTGVSARYAFPREYGDVHIGFYNGDGYQRAETNDQKAIQARASFRPLPQHAMWKGLTLGLFYDSDHYIADGERERFAPFALMETKWARFGLEAIDAHDRTSRTRPSLHGQGYSLWATPRVTKTIELLVRHDRATPDKSIDGTKTRDIFGVAYWIPNLQRVTSAVMVDGERVEYDGIARADETRYAVRLLVTF